MTETDTGRLDGFAYRTTVADVTSSPLVAIDDRATVIEAARAMRRAGISALAVRLDGGLGIVTERDLVDAMARLGAGAIAAATGSIATRPVHTVPASAHVYVALGRMARLGVRHLVVLDDAGRPAGMVTARALLKRRAGGALALGDDVASAPDAAGLRRVKDALPGLARSLLAEGLDARDVASVISAVTRDMTARACDLAAEALAREGHGPAPAAWCCLVLGSAGRGESLLAADQDNALIHEGAEGEPWFARLGERMAAMLDEAGLPLCKGGVMAARPAWRHTPAGWRALLDGWVARAEGESLLAVDIFYDFVPVAGVARLAADLRAAAMTAARAPMLLKMLAHGLSDLAGPFDLLGRLRTEAGRVDLKLHGLHPIVAAARVLALARGVAATPTAERLRQVGAAGGLPEADRITADEAHETLLRLVLEQQIDDCAAGRAPGSTIDAGRLSPFGRRRLKATLRHAIDFAAGAKDSVRFGSS